MRFEIKGTFSQEFAEKFQALAQQVNDGNTEAMGTLAATLKDESPEAALLLYRQAAELGDAKAMVDLGLMLQKSGGIEEARQWWLLAADLGNPKAMVAVSGTWWPRLSPMKLGGGTRRPPNSGTSTPWKGWQP